VNPYGVIHLDMDQRCRLTICRKTRTLWMLGKAVFPASRAATKAFSEKSSIMLTKCGPGDTDVCMGLQIRRMPARADLRSRLEQSIG